MAYQSQPPYTSPGMENVVPVGPVSSRRRIGTRPGVSKEFYDRIGGTGGEYEIRSLQSVSVIRPASVSSWIDVFSPPGLDNTWEQRQFIGNLPVVNPSGQVVGNFDVIKGAVRNPIKFNSLAEYTINMTVSPDTQYDAQFTIYAQMDEIDPDATRNGVTWTLDLNGTAYTSTLDFYHGGTRLNPSGQETGTISSATASGVMKMVVNQNGTRGFVACYYNDVLLQSWPGPSFVGFSDYSGTRVGFSVGVEDRA